MLRIQACLCALALAPACTPASDGGEPTSPSTTTTTTADASDTGDQDDTDTPTTTGDPSTTTTTPSTTTGSSDTGETGPTPPPLTACPLTGDGALIAPAACFVFTPAEAGAQHGEIDEPSIALEPGAAPVGALVVYLNASQSSPSRQIADPTRNFYNAAALAGYHVLALSYRSSLVIGANNQCGDDADCYPATRKAILRGEVDGPVAPGVADITLDEGIVARLDAALRLLDERRPDQGWGQFLTADPDPALRVLWPHIVAAGHSQGGGHAAFMGRVFPVQRVIQLASTCDQVDGAPAPWTTPDATWASTPAATYFGFASATDAVICPAHHAVWDAMGMAEARKIDDAATCNGGGHGGPIACPDNFAAWQSLLQ